MIVLIRVRILHIQLSDYYSIRGLVAVKKSSEPDALNQSIFGQPFLPKSNLADSIFDEEYFRRK
jgi:hypothetical protein